MSATLNGWHQYDYKASWVAIFILFLIWWLLYIPRIFISSPSKEDVSMDPSIGNPLKKYKRTQNHLFAGMVTLFLAVMLSWMANASYGTVNALSWIFFAFWMAIAIGVFIWSSGRKILMALAFLNLVFLIAIMLNAFANPNVIQ